MLRSLARLAPALRLTRVTTAFAAVANVWFVILWTRATPEEPAHAALASGSVWVQLFGGFLVATGLYSFAAAGNDVLDVRRDKALKRNRPIASGALSAEAAVAIITCSLVVASIGASLLGLWSTRLLLVLALAILFYNFTGRHFPSVRVVLLGLIFAIHMFIPNPHLAFVWPIWLAMTHSLAVSAMTHSYSGGRPPLTRGAIMAATTGWMFWSMALIGVGWYRSGDFWPHWANARGALFVLALAALFTLLVWRIHHRSTGRQAADRVMRFGGFWLALYGGAWLLGQGHTNEGVAILLVAIVGFTGAIVLHELAARLERPLDYRL